MAKKRKKQKQVQRNQRNQKNQKQRKEIQEKPKYPIFTARLRRWIGVIFMVLLAVVISFAFFEKAGKGGELVFKGLNFLIGKTIFFVPFLLFLGGILVWKPQKKRVLAPIFLSILLLIFGISGIFTTQDITQKNGGWLGYILGWPFFHYFGIAIAFIVFCALVLIGALIFWEFLPKRKVAQKKDKKTEKKEPHLADKKATGGKEKPKFEIKPIGIFQKKKESSLKPESTGFDTEAGAQAPEFPKEVGGEYKRPLLSLLDTAEEKPSGGDIDHNALIIKKTLQNFGIEVEMSEVNVGPTVAQYTLKPAEGVKLSKITSLNNDLALALASHPIRIEAPIPGRSLVGVEVPNKLRAKVKLGGLIGSSDFQKSPFPLTFALGKDVMGKPILADLGGMPHFLVAGSTGSGKTICLNALITSLIFRNSPKVLRLILIDPKRVEFPVYSTLPHLLTPIIFNSQKAVNALNWLVSEMERRFEVLREFGAREILSYNKSLQEKPKRKQEGFEVMPYIILVIDELADLMAAKGREVEVGIVRLSQLARAVGIHLVVATQRPSVEVITGLIKANITARIAFQVASQIDSRTILDTSGAEKLLGKGDMLFLSSEFSRPKRVQGSFISGAEIKKVVKFIDKENVPEEKEELEEDLGKELEEWVETENKTQGTASAEEPLYEEAKKVVMEYKKASASLLQRRLRIGYARAARILDILEEEGAVGPQDGAKPREVYIRKKEDGGFQDPSDIEFEYK